MYCFLNCIFIQVVGTYNNRKVENLIPFQFSNASQVETLFDEIQPSIIINCIAIRQPDIVEKDPITTGLLNGITDQIV